jgi:hypothetical protein
LLSEALSSPARQMRRDGALEGFRNIAISSCFFWSADVLIAPMTDSVHKFFAEFTE